MNSKDKLSQQTFPKENTEGSFSSKKRDFVLTQDRVRSNYPDHIHFIVEPEIRDFLPPLSESELANLHRQLDLDGIKNPLVFWKRSSVEGDPLVLIDGHNREAWAKANDRFFDYIIKEFDSLDAVKEYMIQTQKGRRNFNAVENLYYAGYLVHQLRHKNELKFDAVLKTLMQQTKENEAYLSRGYYIFVACQHFSEELRNLVLTNRLESPVPIVKIATLSKYAGPKIENEFQLKEALQKMKPAKKVTVVNSKKAVRLTENYWKRPDEKKLEELTEIMREYLAQYNSLKRGGE